MTTPNPKVLVKNSVLLYIRMIFVLAINLYATRVLLKNIGVEDFGIYNVIGSIVVFASFLKNALTNATARYLTYELGTGDKKQLNKVFSMALNCHYVLAICLFIVIEIVGVYFLNTKLIIPDHRIVAANWVFQFSLISFCLSIIYIPYHSNVIAHERMDFYAVVSIVETLLKLISAIMIAYFFYDKLILYAGLIFVMHVIIFIIYCAYNNRKISYVKYERVWDKDLLKKFSSYSGWSMLVNGADVATQQSISIFFNMFLGLVANAALGLANQINSGMLAFTTNMSQAYNPQIIKSYASGDYNYFYKLIFAASKISFILQLVISLPVIFNIQLILNIWLGECPEMTADLVKIIVVFYMIDAFQYPLIQAIYAQGDIKKHQIIIGIIKLIVIPIMYVIIRLTLSPFWTLFIWILGGLACVVFRTFYVKSLLKLNLKDYATSVLIKIIIISLIAYCSTYMVSFLSANSIIRLVLTTCVSTLTIMIVGYVYVLSKNEKRFIKSIPIVHKILNLIK